MFCFKHTKYLCHSFRFCFYLFLFCFYIYFIFLPFPVYIFVSVIATSQEPHEKHIEHTNKQLESNSRYHIKCSIKKRILGHFASASFIKPCFTIIGYLYYIENVTWMGIGYIYFRICVDVMVLYYTIISLFLCICVCVCSSLSDFLNF